MAATISDSLADIRQANVLSGDAVVQDGTLAAKSIQEGRFRLASKLLRRDAVPDSKICEMRHYETRYLIDAQETRAYSSSSNSGKIVVEVVKGRRYRPCALSEDSDLLWSVIPAMARGQCIQTYLAGISTKRCDVLLYPLQGNLLVVQAEV